MKRESKRKGIIERLCYYLGRQNFASDFLDTISNWLFLQPVPAFNGFGLPSNSKLPKHKTDNDWNKGTALMMSRPTAWHAGSDGRQANPTPLEPNKGTPRPETIIPWRWLIGPLGWFWHEDAKKEAKKHAPAPCSDMKYHGMHGQPCKFAGGTDNKCPKGTVSGWFWAYEVPGLGRIYYVDCCGTSGDKSDVWCNWSSEPNWCMVYGRAQNQGVSKYNCTLAISESDMNVVDLGGGKYEVGGVDQ
jgi:hypothetical protein